MSGFTIEQALELGIHYQNTGKLEEAQNIYEQILKACPNVSDAWNLLGLIDYTRGSYDAARHKMEKAISINSKVGFYYLNLGETFRKLGKYQDSIITLKKALEVDEADSSVHFNLANAYKAAEDWKKAEKHFQRALELNASDVDSCYNYGNLLFESARTQEAKELYRKALSYSPQHIGATNNLARILMEEGELEEAEQLFVKANRAAPGDWSVLYNLANTKRRQKEYASALEAYTKSLALNPGGLSIRINRAFTYLESGDFESGWKEYEARLEIDDMPFPKGMILWQGEELAGKTILVHHEQGFGDTLMFSRFLPELSDVAQKVLFLPQTELLSLYQDQPWNVRCIESFEEETYDIAIALGSVPAALNLVKKTRFHAQAYLRSAKKLEVLESIGGRPKIGLFWKSETSNRLSKKKSIPCSLIEEIVSQFPRALFYSLQPEKEGAVPENLVNLSERISDFNDTASLIQMLDGVISVDSAVAHLAAALGKPTHVILPFDPDWRWEREGSTSYWYKSATLHRQDSPDQWEKVLKEGFDSLLRKV